MSGDDARNAALVEFVGTFATVSENIEEISDLRDGVALFEALSEMYVDCSDRMKRMASSFNLVASK